MIVSPCISICKSDPDTGFCYGCARNSDEKLRWKDKNTSHDWKLKNFIDIAWFWEYDQFKHNKGKA